MLTNKRAQWALFDVDAGIQTQVLVPSGGGCLFGRTAFPGLTMVFPSLVVAGAGQEAVSANACRTARGPTGVFQLGCDGFGKLSTNDLVAQHTAPCRGSAEIDEPIAGLQVIRGYGAPVAVGDMRVLQDEDCNFTVEFMTALSAE